MNRGLLAGSIMIAIAVMAVAGTGDAPITPLPLRTSDQVISADFATLESVQNRLIALNEKGVPSTNYFWAKAQAWLDFAYDEYTENDRTGVIRGILSQAIGLIVQLESGTAVIAMDTPLLHGTRQREDLWQIAEELKQSPGFAAAAPHIAKLEVKLVQYSHEVAELGWRHARDMLDEIESLAVRARASTASYRLHLATGVSGHGRIEPAPDQDDYGVGDTISLRTVAGVGWLFDSWQGGVSGSENPAKIKMLRDTAVTAVFRRQTCQIDVQTGNGGRVETGHEGETVYYGDPLTFLAVPAPGWAFDHWDGALSGQSNPIFINAEGPLQASAIFRPIDYTIAPRTVGRGSIVFQPAQRYYRFGDQVSAKAVPEAGWRFDHWEDALSGEANPAGLRVDSSRILTAVFHPSSTSTTAPAPGVLRLPGMVHFAFDEATISMQTAAILDQVAKALRENDDLSLLLIGNADIQGASYYNMVLSLDRVEAVRSYLIKAGAPAARIAIDYRGDAQPFYLGTALPVYALNRRVELRYRTGSLQIEVYVPEEDLQP